MFKRLLFLLATTLSIGCSPTENASLGSTDSSLAVGLSPAPANEPNVLDQLKRYRGQLKFLNLSYMSRGNLEAAPGAPADAKAGSGRAIQESDVFKVGKPGSKLLYLLNNVRGLQVVSFVEGADKPKLLGRVQATGNYPDDMYFDSANDRLLVLERLWNSGSDYNEEQSRIVVYDVKNPAEPKISEVVPFAGEVYDSRLVGDVLYTVGSLRADNSSDSSAKPKGLVQSFRVSRGGIKLVQKLELSLAAVYGQNLNIITTEEAGKPKYYLTAVVSENTWAWFGRQSLVEVVDISDAKGKIQPVMVASVKGMVRERSATAVKNRTLIVTSNYAVKASDNRQIGRVAVETFNFPESSSEIIDEDEARFRQMNIERELKGMPVGDARDKRAEELAADEKLGIKGRFVQSNMTLRKIVADSSATVGDTTGMSADLQDVRYEGDLLYVFWVPTNQIDPFDLFDISAPEKGIKYLGRLQFDGWVERSIPMTVADRKFVIGLGYVVPAVNNEHNRRVPQVVLFEVKESQGKWQASSVATLTMSEANGWADFNSGDKFIEVRPTGEGKGEILFEISTFTDGKYLTGGKVISFDINQAVTNNNAKVFREGGLLAGDAGWLRRVFTNPEIDRVNTFSDQALGVFDAASLGTSSGIIKATATLELARNIRAYVSFAKGASLSGIQIISDYSYYGSGGSTELREVNVERADEELDKTLSTVKVAGAYKAHLLANDGNLYLFTQDYVQNTNAKKGDFSYQLSNRVYKFGLAGAGFANLGEVHWTISNDNNRRRPLITADRGGLLQLPSGAIFVQDGRTLRRVETAATGLAVSEIQIDRTCGRLTENSSMILDMVSNHLFLSKTQTVDEKTYPGWTLTRNLVSPTRLDGKRLKCGAEFNIPGKLIMATDGYVITEDEGVLDVIKRESEREVGDGQKSKFKSYEFKTQKAYVSLKLSNENATLIDQLTLDENSYYEKHLLDDKTLVYLENVGGSSGGGWRPGRRHTMSWPGHGGTVPAEPRLSYLSLDNKGFLVQDVHYLQLDITGANLGELFKDMNTSSHYAVVSNSKEMQVLRLDAATRSPSVIELIPLDERFRRMTARKVVHLGGYHYVDNVNFTSALNSFEVPMGLSGIKQFFIK